MNVHFARSAARTTQAAEGLPRRAWTVDEVVKMVAAGIIDEDERVELIGGEMVPMSPKGIRHENVKNDLLRHLYKNVPDALSIAVETTLYVTEDAFYEPDIIIWPRSFRRIDIKNDIPVPELALLIEVSDPSLNYDLGRKRQEYARLGLREYWVINAQSLVTTIHREPDENGFGQVTELTHTDLMTPALAASLAVRLADLGLTPATE